MPDMDELIKDPSNETKYPIPEDNAMLFAISAALASRANPKTYKNIIIYAERMPADYGVRTIKDILRKDPGLSGTEEFTKYAAKHRRLFAR